MHNNFNVKLLLLALSLATLAGCGIGRKSDPILKENPYKIGGKQNLAFYGKVVDKVTHETPDFPVTIEITPDDPGNHTVIDSCNFYIEDKGLDPTFSYSLVISADPDYARLELPLKYIKGRAQNLGLIEIENIRPGTPGIHLVPFTEFNPGASVIEKPGWSISSFLDSWKSVNQPFMVEDVEQHIKETLPAGSPEISKAEIKQAIDGWLKDGLIKSSGRNTYMIK